MVWYKAPLPYYASRIKNVKSHDQFSVVLDIHFHESYVQDNIECLRVFLRQTRRIPPNRVLSGVPATGADLIAADCIVHSKGDQPEVISSTTQTSPSFS